MGQGGRGATESSAGASLTHVGQSSVEIGLMNRGERAKRRGGSSFNITRHYRLKHHSSGRGRDREVRGWRLRTSERDLETSHLLLNCQGWWWTPDRGSTRHWELPVSACSFSHWPLTECVSGPCPRPLHLRLVWMMSALFDGSLSSRRDRSRFHDGDVLL